MSTLRFGGAVWLVWVASAAQVAAQGYAQQQQGYEQQQPQYQQQYPQYQQAYPQGQFQQQQYQQPGDQQQPPPGYFPTPDAQGSYGYQQQYAPNGVYPQQQQGQGYGEEQQPAEDPLVSSVRHAFQISAGLALFHYTSLGIEQTGVSPPVASDPMPAPGAPPVAAAPAPQQFLYGRTDRHPLNLELGYGLTDKMLLGVIFQMAGSSETLEANGGKAPVSDFMFALAPKFEYHFLPSSRWNPFIGAVASIAWLSKESGAYSDSRTLFGLAFRGGLRYFALDQLSIDPSLLIGFNTGSGTQKQSGGAQPVEFKDSLSGMQFAISMGVSFYIK
jgi:hypothetical protein